MKRKNKKSLFMEYINMTDMVYRTNTAVSDSVPQTPIKTQIQNLLSRLPDKEMLDELEGQVRTLRTSMNVINFESPSMDASVQSLINDVLDIKVKLTSINSRVEDMLRDMEIADPSHEGEDNPVPELEKGSIENKTMTEVKWQGLSKDTPLSHFNKDDLKHGAKIEMEHTKDWNLAVHIAADHLYENPNYYKILDKVGL